MKKSLLSISLVLHVFFVQSQQPYIATPTIIPQNPSSSSVIKVLTKVTTANQGIIVDNNTFTVSGLQIKIKGCYWQGMLTATQDYIDTLTIGLLPPGNYQVIQKAYLSTTQQHCSIIDSNVINFQIQVSTTTKLNEQQFINDINIYPNPATNKLFVLGTEKVNTVELYSVSGALLKKELLKDKSINVSDLPNGLYVLKFKEENSDEQHLLKFIKIE